MITSNERIILKAIRRAPSIEIRIKDGVSSNLLSFEKDGEFNRDLADAVYGYLFRKHGKESRNNLP